MALPVFIAALLGKAAVGAVTKSVAAKAAAAAAKTAVGHHGHAVAANKVAATIIDQATDKAVDAAAENASAALAKARDKSRR